MNTKIRNLSDMIPIEDQIKVIDALILKGHYNKLPELAEQGYCFNIYHFDLLHQCGQDEVLNEIWNTDFTFKGMNKAVFTYLIMCKGEVEAAHFVAHRTEKCKVWQTCYQQFTPAMLEAVEDWDTLCRKGCYEILAQNGKFDLIINSFNRHNVSITCASNGFIAKGVKVLRQHNMVERIMELGQYGWFMSKEWMPEGVKILMEAGKFNTIYEYCKPISSIIPDAIKCMCKTEEGREFLRSKGEYSWLVQCGHPEILVTDKKWGVLARHRKYEFIDWDSWLAISSDSKEVFEAAAIADQWEFLAKNKKRLMLIKNREFKLFFSTFKEVFAKKQELDDDIIVT